MHGVVAAGIASLAVVAALHFLVAMPGERWSRSVLTKPQALPVKVIQVE